MKTKINAVAQLIGSFSDEIEHEFTGALSIAEGAELAVALFSRARARPGWRASFASSGS
jgi:hypothetical protein